MTDKTNKLVIVDEVEILDKSTIAKLTDMREVEIKKIARDSRKLNPRTRVIYICAPRGPYP